MGDDQEPDPEIAGSYARVPERDRLVGAGNLERANAAVGLGTKGGETLGPLVAALLLPVLGARGGGRTAAGRGRHRTPGRLASTIRPS